MFGTLGKLIGGILVLVGAIAMLIGPAVAAYGLDDQADNEQDGLLEDNERTEQNGAAVLAGAATAGAGVLVAVVGLVIVGISAAGSNAWLQKKTRDGKRQLSEVS